MRPVLSYQLLLVRHFMVPQLALGEIIAMLLNYVY